MGDRGSEGGRIEGVGDSGSEGGRKDGVGEGGRERRSCCSRVRPLSSRLQRSHFHSDSAAAFVALLVCAN